MIFYSDKSAYIECNSSVGDAIYGRMYNGNSPITINIQSPGKISEGLFKVITMFDYGVSSDFSSYGKYNNKSEIKNIQYCIFGDVNHYNPGTYEGNHLCGARLAESDEVGIHWSPDFPGTQEMRGFINSKQVFGQDVKLVGKGYSNNVANPLWWTDTDGYKWEAPMIFHSNFSTSQIDFETFGLNMTPDVIGTELWKKEKMNAPTTGLGTYREQFNYSAGAYAAANMSATERNRYIAQLTPYVKTKHPTQRFKLDVIEKTSGLYTIGVSKEFISSNTLGDLYSTAWGSNAGDAIFAYKFYTPSTLQGNPDYFTVEGNGHLETQEYVVPVIFGKFATTSGTFGYAKAGISYSYDVNSKNSIIALAKACVHNNVKNNRHDYKNELSVYTLDGGLHYIFSEAIDLRNISTSGAVRGKTTVNNGDIVLIADSQVYVITEQQAVDYIFPAVDTSKPGGNDPIGPVPAGY